MLPPHMLTEEAAYAAGQFGLQMALGVGALFPPYPNAPAAGHFISAAKWGVLMAGAGIAAGATSGGGAGGTGQTQLGSGGPQPLKPVQTRTSMEDQLIKLNENLVIQGRVMQYAGQQYDKVGATMFQMEHDINMMAVSNKQGWQDAAADLITHFDNSVKNGFQNITDVNQGIQNYMKDYSNTLPKVLSGTLSTNLQQVAFQTNGQNQQLISLSKAQLVELQKANDKNMQPVFNTNVSIDGPGFSSMVEGQFVKTAGSRVGQAAIVGSTAAATAGNLNRQALGRSLSGSGGV